MRSQKERETELKEKQMENMSKAQQDLTNLLQQQICHQQEQTQRLIQQQLQVQIQQQQMNAFLSVLSEFAEKRGKTLTFFMFVRGFHQILSHHGKQIKVN